MLLRNIGSVKEKAPGAGEQITASSGRQSAPSIDAKSPTEQSISAFAGDARGIDELDFRLPEPEALKERCDKDRYREEVETRASRISAEHGIATRWKDQPTFENGE